MTIIISSEYNGKTVLQLLQGPLAMSHKAISRLKRLDRGILLNGVRVTVRAMLSEGDCLCLECDDRYDETDPFLEKVNIPVEILYEDDDIIIPNKPFGMPMHQSLGHKSDSLANALAYYFGDKPFIFRAVNRLDRDTSGVCIIAKNRRSAMQLSRQMADKQMQKTYLAILDGVISPESGIIDKPIKRKEESIITRVVCSPDDEGARRALTSYRLLGVKDNRSLVECNPITGRTHQLRVHFASCSHPITGDTLYGSESPLISRQALHASAISFTHPTTDLPMTVSAPLPEDMKRLI